jgi:hypothetical protein
MTKGFTLNREQVTRFSDRKPTQEAYYHSVTATVRGYFIWIAGVWYRNCGK